MEKSDRRLRVLIKGMSGLKEKLRAEQRWAIRNVAIRTHKIKSMASPTTAAPKREKDPMKRIVVTGMGAVSVFGNEVDHFYSKLLEGQSGVCMIDKFDASTFGVRFAAQIRGFSSDGYIAKKRDNRLDDCWRYCLVAGSKALENASLGPDVLRKVC
ncbi:uncharacterized protein A4U43_C05F20790 [Asparagus officinalis]|uniref:beta-ketoacyl-[acyl-carrier-protein] synthase I n=1 Tax=Asparagus officinalis TaxID=4686 RepID=A0A5P1EYK4_ASPOF|nr:uncharacterized protein A4U43_C05F20790 [Asparagus officinalis]